jgi:acyl carrier protein
MTRDDVRARVLDVLEDVLGRDDIDLNDQDSAKTIEGWDSLSHIRIMASIERVFGIRFTNAEFVKLLNVGDLIDKIQGKMEDVV